MAHTKRLGAGVRETIDKLPFESFMPMTEQKVVQQGKEVKREVPLALNYVFFRTDDFLSLQRTLRNISCVHIIYHAPMRDARPNSEHAIYKPMIASDHEMEMFMKAASFYTKGAPLSVPDRKMMQKGDMVRIIDGPFKGVEGVLITQQGKDGGKVVVSISNLVSISTIDIAPENIQVIKFAHGNKHIYKKMDSFVGRIDKATKKRDAGEPQTTEEREAIESFIKRFSAVETDTVNTEAKLNMLIMQGYMLMEMPKQAIVYYQKLRDEILPKVKSEKVREKLTKVMESVARVN